MTAVFWTRYLHGMFHNILKFHKVKTKVTFFFFLIESMSREGERERERIVNKPHAQHRV